VAIAIPDRMLHYNHVITIAAYEIRPYRAQIGSLGANLKGHRATT
jgi:hypothetical protein